MSSTEQKLVVVTGAAGFIGSVLASTLLQQNRKVILVDDFSVLAKQANYQNKNWEALIDRNQFIQWLQQNPNNVEMIYHLGARTDTTEMDMEVLKKWNLDYSKAVWQEAAIQNIPLVYASSAATYGNGDKGYKDDQSMIPNLQPLNPYGISKQEFDEWALMQIDAPPFWAGVKFFNVYGPNEFHKGRMASVIFHAYNQIKKNGAMNLFRSHHPDFSDGGQMRDFIYVNDIVNICTWLMNHTPESGIYNAGTGKARTFIDLAKAVFHAMQVKEQIHFIDTPEDIRDKYQYFTEADMNKIKEAGYTQEFTSLEDGIYQYVTQYLQTGNYF